MKVSRQGLLDVIVQAEEKHAVQAERWQEAYKAWTARRRSRWLERKAPEWKALRDLITKSLKNGTPITSDMVNSVFTGTRYSAYWTDHTFSQSATTPNDGLRHPDGEMVRRPESLNPDLAPLKLFLEKYPEETLTLEGLARAGFKAPSWVFRAAVGA